MEKEGECDCPTSKPVFSLTPALFHTVPLLLSLMTLAFKSPRPEHPKLLLPGTALSDLPADSSFPTWARPDSHHLSPRRISGGGALHRKGERNSMVVPPFQASPDVSVHSRGSCFYRVPKLSCRGSPHTTVARGTALWESLVGKPCWKASWESLEGKPLIP